MKLFLRCLSHLFLSVKTAFLKRSIKISLVAAILFLLTGNISAQTKENQSKEKAVEAKKDRKDEPGEALAFEIERTKNPATGKVPWTQLRVAMEQTDQLKNNSLNRTTAALSWIERGPTGDFKGPQGNPRPTGQQTSGRIRGSMVDSLDATKKTVWAGGVNGGLWKTTDITVAPANWVLVNDFLSNLAVSDICQDPRPGFQNIMYFCTGESYGNADAVRGVGVFKSIDAGATWTFLASTSSYLNGTRILCDFQGNVYLGTRGTGLLRSTNGGTSWTNITPTGLNNDICDLEISSTAVAGRLHVTTGIFSASSYRYTDIPTTVTSGTWTTATTPYTAFSNRTEIAISGNTLYALPCNASYEVSQIWKSIDGGANWAVTGAQPSSGWANGQGWYDLAAGINPANSDELIVGGLDCYRTLDGGTSWTKITSWATSTAGFYVHADHHDIQWWDGGNKLLFACDGGIYFSTDKGSNSTDRNQGLRIKQFYSIAIHPNETNYFIAGAQDNGMHRLNHVGLDSSIETYGGDGAYCAIDQNEPQFQFGSYVYNVYRRSTNNGATWSTPVNNQLSGRFINPWDYDNTGNIIYACNASGNFLRWNNPQTGSLTDVVTATGQSGNVSAVHVSPYTANRVFFGTGIGNLYIVDNANTGTTVTATSISPGLGAYLNCVVTGSSDQNLIACYSSYGVNNVWLSTNGGTSWTQCDGNLPDMPVRWALFNPDDNTKAYIATETGVWETDLLNGGATVWVPNTSFPNVRVDMIKYRASDRTIAAGTHGRGIWTTTIPPLVAAAPTVTINQAAAQPDPTSASPINFTVVFSEPVTGFTAAGVNLSGTAGATTKVVTGGPTTYNVAVSGMTSSGTVIANVPANAATGTVNVTGNDASTSTDNTVTYNLPVVVPPTVTINQAAAQPDPTSASPINFTVVFSEPVTGFTAAGVNLSGTAGATTKVVTGGPTTYNVAVSGMTSSGTVIANVPANAATGTVNVIGNATSTSTDNTVTFNLATSNDVCSGALPIACGQTINGTTVGATLDVVPTCVTTLSTGPSVWYTFVGDGQNTTLSLCGSSFDTKIGVFTGTCAALVCVTGNDDFCGLQSEVTFSTINGTTYYVMVTGFSTNAGAFTLTRTCTPPLIANDACGNALPIACGQTINGTTVGATSDAVPTCITTLNTAPGVWYTFVGNGLSNTLSLCGSGYDTKIGIFTGTCAALVCAVGNDDFCGLQSQVTFTAVNGTTYYVLVTGFGTNAGVFTLARTCVCPTLSVDPVSNQGVCNGAASTPVTFTGAEPSTVYTWTNDNTSFGLAASGTGNIASFTATNAGTTPLTATITVTPTYPGCPNGPSATFTITVNPTPQVDQPADQTVCNGTMTAPVNFTTTVPGTTFAWSNNTPSIGLAASGTGNIAAFTATNATTLPVTGTITVTPTIVNPPSTVSTSGFLNNNANALVTFNFRNTNSTPVTITGIESICSTSGQKDVTAFFKTSAINGPPGAISVANGWNSFGTAVITGIANTTTTTTQPFMSGLSLVVPPGATYGIAIQAVDQGTTTSAMRYSTIGAGPFTFTTNGCDLISGANISYGGVAAPGAPTFTPRAFLGKVNFTNSCAGPSKTFDITVNPTPTITCPANMTVASDIGVCNKTVNYTPTVTGTPAPTLSYVLTGATTGSGAGSGSGLKFNVGVTTVTVTATNTCATVSCSFTITVTDSQLPTVTTQPANRTVCAGSNATFTVVAVTAPSAGGPIAYQWQLWNGSTWNNIAGATAATLTLNSVTQTMNTNSYRVQLTGLCSTVFSNFATLYVNPLPTINLTTSIPPALLPTQVLTITATTAPGGGSYVWFKNGVVIPGATGNTLAGLTVSDIGTYRVVYTDGNGCVATSANVDITGQPSDNLYVYPVPNQGVFNVRFYNQANEQVTVRVFDAKGAEVYSRKVLTTIPYTTINVDLSTNQPLANGTYVVDVRGADGRLMGSRKIIVYNR